MTIGTYRFFALAWAVLIALALILPGEALPVVPSWMPESLLPMLDKAVHAGLFFVMHLLLVLATGRKTPSLAFPVALLGLSYALVLELAQTFIPGRAWEGLDLLASLVGIGLAMALVEIGVVVRSAQQPRRR